MMKLTPNLVRNIYVNVLKRGYEIKIINDQWAIRNKSWDNKWWSYEFNSDGYWTFIRIEK